MLVTTGDLSDGFRLPGAGLQIFARPTSSTRSAVHKRRPRAGLLSDFRDLKIGDHVVHVEHGVGMFVGLKKLTVGLDAHEFMELRYSGDDKLFVPVERLRPDSEVPAAARVRRSIDLGGRTPEKARTRVKKAMRDMADELLKLYAQRKAITGHAFASDSHWQEEFEGAFEFDLDDVNQEICRGRTSSATWNRPRRWIACSAATSATARPKWRCAQRSRR